MRYGLPLKLRLAWNSWPPSCLSLLSTGTSFFFKDYKLPLNIHRCSVFNHLPVDGYSCCLEAEFSVYAVAIRNSTLTIFYIFKLLKPFPKYTLPLINVSGCISLLHATVFSFFLFNTSARTRTRAHTHAYTYRCHATQKHRGRGETL